MILDEDHWNGIKSAVPLCIEKISIAELIAIISRFSK
jgi:hypothetical protein